MDKLKIDTEKGWREISINENCDFSEFYKVAEYLQYKLDTKFITKVDDFDSLYWSFLFKNNELMLHYNIYMGISLFPAKFKECTEDDNKAALELGQIISEDLYQKRAI